MVYDKVIFINIVFKDLIPYLNIYVIYKDVLLNWNDTWRKLIHCAKRKLEPEGALIAHLSTMSSSVIS